MAFIRTKKIKNKYYAYLIENKWTKKGPRQKKNKYLGKIIDLKVVQELRDLTFEDFLKKINSNALNEINLIDNFFKNNSSKEILNHIIFYELYKRGFKKYSKGLRSNKLVLNKDNIFLDLKFLKIYAIEEILKNKTKKKIVLKLDTDFMCDYSLKKLYRFMEFGSEIEIAEKLAKSFIFAGIQIEEDIFIRFFKKTFKNNALRIF